MSELGLGENGPMRTRKYAEIEKYLSRNIPNNGIERKHDFELSAQVFNIHIEDDSLLLEVTERFVDENDLFEIIRRFMEWRLPELLAQNSDSTVLVGNDGASIVNRS
jgi:hypothetical protein